MVAKTFRHQKHLAAAQDLSSLNAEAILYFMPGLTQMQAKFCLCVFLQMGTDAGLAAVS